MIGYTFPMVRATSNYPTDDSYVDSSNPDLNYGIDQLLFISNNGPSRIENAYFKFSTVGLSGSDVEFCFYVGTAMTTFHLAIWVVSNDWDENNITYNQLPSQTIAKVDEDDVSGFNTYGVNITPYITGSVISLEINCSYAGVWACSISSKEGAHPPYITDNANAPPINWNIILLITIIAIIAIVAVSVILLIFRKRRTPAPPIISQQPQPKRPQQQQQQQQVMVVNLPPAPAPPYQYSATPSIPLKRFCIFCGSELEPDATFCTHCGKQQR